MTAENECIFCPFLPRYWSNTSVPREGCVVFQDASHMHMEYCIRASIFSVEYTTSEILEGRSVHFWLWKFTYVLTMGFSKSLVFQYFESRCSDER